jgi:hypothetical protein
MNKNKGTTDLSSQQSEKNVNKVIRLKTPGTRRVEMKLEMNEKKAALTASILSVVALATFFNQKIMTHFETKSSRSIASLNEQSQFEFDWQKDLAAKLSEKSNRKVASYGETPSKLDEIRFGTLEGKYSFSFNNDTISEIKFQETAAADRPKYIPNFENFLMENKDVFVPELSLIKSVDTKMAADTKEETLELFNATNKTLGRVTYISDHSGRFLSMKFEATP